MDNTTETVKSIKNGTQCNTKAWRDRRMAKDNQLNDIDIHEGNLGSSTLTFRLSVLLLLFLGLHSGFICNEKKSEPEPSSNEYFHVIEATFSKWVAGIEGGGSGTEYYFKTYITTREPIGFDSAWIAGAGFRIFIAREQGPVTNQEIQFTSTDTIILRVSAHDKIKQKVAPPFDYKGAALLRYSLNGIYLYHIIDLMKEVPSTNRP
ncbi:MAG: hypothetical protein IIA45_02115 [Bacteroidetes bacterium]|nr:hypothetical protein [Bacteroidota bacterium]